jgi:hypothetical protein
MRRLPFALCVTLLVVSASAAQEKISLEPQQKWSNVFGGKEVDFTFRVSGPFQGRASWNFSLNQRTLASREVPITSAPGKPADLVVHLDLPKVKDGLSLKTRLLVSIYAQGSNPPAATLEKTLWIFPANPFAGQAQWLRVLKITLYDPPGTTARVFKEMDIPFVEARDLEALNAVRAGTVIIGEGVSFQEQRVLPELIVKLAARGLPVLCLAPSDGILPIPVAQDAGLRRPEGFSIRRQNIITRLDKRLDAEEWPGGKVVLSSVALKGDGAATVGEAIQGKEGWPWMEIDFPTARGKVIVCGFGLMSNWDASPAPRFLFARILERLTGTPSETSEPKDGEVSSKRLQDRGAD